jgi:predicted PurR-regulated permease PerM
MVRAPAFGPGSRFFIVIAAIVVVTAGLRAARPVLLPITLAVFFAIVSQPLLEGLKRLPLPMGRRIPHPVAAVLTVCLDLALLAVVVWLLSTSVLGFRAALPRYEERLGQLWDAAVAWAAALGVDISGRRLRDLIGTDTLFGALQDTATALTGFLTRLVLVVLTLFFTLLEQPRIPRKLRAAFGREAQAQERMLKVAAEILVYLRVKTLISIATGVLFGLWVALLGIDFPLLWGFLAFVLNYIPNIGSIVGAIPPTALALVGSGPGTTALVVIGSLVINLGLSNAVEPQMMGRSLGLSPLVVFISVILGGWVWGPMGIVLGVPITMAMKILFENTEDLRWVAVLMGRNAPPHAAPPHAAPRPPEARSA